MYTFMCIHYLLRARSGPGMWRTCPASGHQFRWILRNNGGNSLLFNARRAREAFKKPTTMPVLFPDVVFTSAWAHPFVPPAYPIINCGALMPPDDVMFTCEIATFQTDPPQTLIFFCFLYWTSVKNTK